jgi:hypothetical protein
VNISWWPRSRRTRSQRWKSPRRTPRLWGFGIDLHQGMEFESISEASSGMVGGESMVGVEPCWTPKNRIDPKSGVSAEESLNPIAQDTKMLSFTEARFGCSKVTESYHRISDVQFYGHFVHGKMMENDDTHW